MTIDAAGCQVENARVIRQQEGHYLLAVTDNQTALHDAVQAVFDRACEADFEGSGATGTSRRRTATAGMRSGR